MTKHKSEDYKLSAVKYYLKGEKTQEEICKIYECSVRSLMRWVDRYKVEKEIKRHNRKNISYKITKKQVKYALKKQKENEQITMEELAKIVKKKYNDFDITPQHLGQILRDNNITRKRTRREHYPKERYGKHTNQTKELKIFYKEIRKYSLSKIICLDETSIQPAMYPAYSKCPLGKRCIIKTDDNYVFRKFTLLCAINNKKCVGTSLYKEGGMIFYIFL
jgi:transposase